MQIKHRAEYRCTPWQLWPYIDEPDKQKQWLTTLIDAVPTSQLARAVGTTFAMRFREGWRVASYEGRINAYDPPRHLGVSFWGGALAPRMVMRVDYRVADLGSRTRLEYYADIDTEPLRGLLKVLIPLAWTFTSLQVRYFMRRLRHLVEADARRAAEARPAKQHEPR
jgi:hypothetical protein